MPRWKYRFDNYSRQFLLLQEAIEIMDERPLTQLEKEGTARRFKVGMELAWNLVKDYLESQNVVLETVTPRNVLRQAFSAKVVSDGTVWMDALDARNRMSHMYDFELFENTLADIRERYLPAMRELYLFFAQEGRARIDRPPARGILPQRKTG